MIVKRFRSFVILMVLFLGQAPGDKSPRSPADRPESGPPIDYDLKVEIRPSKGEYLQGEPVKIRVGIANGSESVIVYDGLCSLYGLLELYVYKEGELAQKTEYYQASRAKRWISDHRFETLDKRRPLEFDIYPNIVFDMTRPGEYRIVAGAPARECVRDNVKVVYSKPITIRIVERNRF